MKNIAIDILKWSSAFELFDVEDLAVLHVWKWQIIISRAIFFGILIKTTARLCHKVFFPSIVSFLFHLSLLFFAGELKAALVFKMFLPLNNYLPRHG